MYVCKYVFLYMKQIWAVTKQMHGKKQVLLSDNTA